MRTPLFRFLLIVSIAVTAMACANRAPVLNVNNARVFTPSGVAPSAAHTRDGIMRGLLAKGWTVGGESDQSIVASVSEGGHSARVVLQYDAQFYSITHIDSSTGLKYDGNTIHRRYNRWVDKLREAINRAFLDTPTGFQPTETKAPPPAASPSTVPPSKPASAPLADEDFVPLPPPPPPPR